jgi:hypothetical protein
VAHDVHAQPDQIQTGDPEGQQHHLRDQDEDTTPAVLPSQSEQPRQRVSSHGQSGGQALPGQKPERGKATPIRGERRGRPHPCPRAPW